MYPVCVCVCADLSESVQSQYVLHRQDTAEVLLYGRLAVCRLTVLSAGSQPGQHLPVLWSLHILTGTQQLGGLVLQK